MKYTIGYHLPVVNNNNLRVHRILVPKYFYIIYIIKDNISLTFQVKMVINSDKITQNDLLVSYKTLKFVLNR